MFIHRKVLFLFSFILKEKVLYFWGRLGFDNAADFLVSMSCADRSHVNKCVQTFKWQHFLRSRSLIRLSQMA